MAFKNLNDPAVRAEMAERHAREEAEQSAFEKKCNDAIQLCEVNDDALAPKEGAFVRSLRQSMAMNRTPSEKQTKWLFDIAERFARTANLLVLDRIGRVLVQKPDGYDFAVMSTDLRGAAVFDQVGAEDAMGRIQALLPADGPFRAQSVRDFKIAFVDSPATPVEIAVATPDPRDTASPPQKANTSPNHPERTEMSAHKMTLTVLATCLADAVRKDEEPSAGGFDLSAGLFGENVSNWLKGVAIELNEPQAHANSESSAWRLPQGYKKHLLPSDYSGDVFLESQVRAAHHSGTQDGAQAYQAEKRKAAAYKWAYEYLQDRIGWVEECTSELAARIAGPNQQQSTAVATPLLNGKITVYLEAYGTSEHHDAPRHAILSVDQQFLDTLLRLQAICIANKLSEVSCYARPDKWEPGDIGRKLGLNEPQLVVTSHNFWFSDEPKNLDYTVKTRIEDITNFLFRCASQPDGATLKMAPADVLGLEEDEQEAPKQYRYALYARPYDLYTTPKGVVEFSEKPQADGPYAEHRDFCRHGFVTYDRQLTPDEVSTFELVPMVDPEDRAEIANQVVMQMGQYKARYLDMHQKDPGQFEDAVHRFLKKTQPNTLSIGSSIEFAEQVKQRLVATVSPNATTEATGQKVKKVRGLSIC